MAKLKLLQVSTKLRLLSGIKKLWADESTEIFPSRKAKK